MAFLLSGTDNVDRLIGFHTATYTGTSGTTFQSVVVNPSISSYSFVEAYWRLQGQTTWVLSPRGTISRDPSPYNTSGVVTYAPETGVIQVSGGKAALTCEVRVFEYLPDVNQPTITIPNAPQELDTLLSTTDVTYRKVATTGTLTVPAGGGTSTFTFAHGQSAIPYVKAWILSGGVGTYLLTPYNNNGARRIEVDATNVSFAGITQDASTTQTVYYRIYEP